MRALRLHGVGDVRVSDEAPPHPGPGEELVRVTAVGLCGSDLHWYAEAGIGDARLDQPLVVGHEFAGVIEGGRRHGVHVAVDPAIPCERCATCLTGHRNLCPTVVFSGHGGHDGALRELLAWPARLLHPLPEELSDDDGAMLEPLGVALHAFDLGHVRVGAAVGVFGCGPIGLLLLQIARSAGVGRIVAADLLPHRRRAAAELGADEVLDAEDPAVLDRAAGAHLDVTFEVGGTDGAVALALKAARPGARVVLAGIPDDDRTSFTASLARRKGLTIAMARRMGDVYPRSIALVEQGLVDVRCLVTHRYPMRQAAEAFEVASARTGLKVMVHPQDAPPGHLP